jgi:hypothetical protein
MSMNIHNQIVGSESSQLLADMFIQHSLGRLDKKDDKPAVVIPKRNYTPYGAARQIPDCTAPTLIFEGVAESGKTFASLVLRVDAMAWAYPGAQIVIVRKVYADIITSVVESYEKNVLGLEQGQDTTIDGIRRYGGVKPFRYDYPNDSVVWIGGLDNAGKVLSSQRDIIYCNQAEELTFEDYSYLKSRCTGRAGNTPFPQIILDCNPAQPTHWINTLQAVSSVDEWNELPDSTIELKERKFQTAVRLKSEHRDNPRLFNQETGEITAQGVLSLSILKDLPGVLRKRLFEGLWAGVEGMVYEDSYSQLHNLKYWSELGWSGQIPPLSWRRVWAIDFGYKNPFACGFFAIDPDNNVYLYRQIYYTKRLVQDHCSTILRAALYDARPDVIVCDHDAEDRATFSRHCVFCVDCDQAISVQDSDRFHSRHTTIRFNLTTKAAYKAIEHGIQAVAKRWRVQGNGKAGLVIVRGGLVERDLSLKQLHKPTCTEDEIEGYAYPKDISGKTIKEIPIDINNHGCDLSRYAIAEIDQIHKIGKTGKPAVGKQRAGYVVR